ncbi:MAG: 60S ribosomal export protein NMD3 [Candidatus ainarchaeum sp.]|nr:60S ribosomal export protein NMD3 [Candidatus ainarchaeum sp.]
MSALFCPGCGSTNGPFFKGLCRDCFLKKHSLFELPPKTVIKRCKTCGRILFLGKWLNQENSLLEKIIEKNMKIFELENPKLKISFSPEEKGKILAKAALSGEICSNKIEQEKEAIIEFTSSLCDSCMKVVSNYYEATIQLRFEKKETGEKIVAEIEKLLSSLSGEDLLAKIVSAKKQKTGIDLVLGSNKSASKIAKAIATKYNAKLVVSYKQAKGGTRDEAKKRFTYCIRI